MLFSNFEQWFDFDHTPLRELSSGGVFVGCGFACS
ncbi:hypothetical protein B6N60_05152 [Richelia sinica FACHB-800]|uniref:Uncharacterized protein n=1 Tax=Richelia sinica FACHB-800 TaxID=1357546 RepID=A0A975TDD5_9NOST|nr:hypothetical protein B6N60_05152 [Richelia sinica FACHB-800]